MKQRPFLYHGIVYYANGNKSDNIEVAASDMQDAMSQVKEQMKERGILGFVVEELYPINPVTHKRIEWHSDIDTVVDHPAHYNQSSIEVIVAIEIWKLNFSRGNAVKCIVRAGHKGSEIEDLKKAEWYIRREIERLEKGQREQERKENA